MHEHCLRKVFSSKRDAKNCLFDLEKSCLKRLPFNLVENKSLSEIYKTMWHVKHKTVPNPKRRNKETNQNQYDQYVVFNCYIYNSSKFQAKINV